MKKKILIILSCIIVFLLYGCESEIIDAEFPYKEEIVIRGILMDGAKIDNIKITRTLPPLENYSEDKAEIKNAKVSVEINKIKYSLFYTEKGRYRNNNVILKPGMECRLSVDWNGKSVTANTNIPNRIIIEKTEQKVYKDMQGDWIIELRAVFKPFKNSAYIGGMDDILNNIITARYYGDEIKRIQDTSSDGKIHLKILEFNTPDTIISLNYIKTLSRFVETYDEPFYYYYRTARDQDEDDEDEDIFKLDEVSAQWNVSGNGFGLFIGKTFTR